MSRKRILMIGAILIFTVSILGFIGKDQILLNEKSVAKILVELGEPKQGHYLEELDTFKIRQGKEIVYTGRTVDSNGKKSRLISKYFVCTNCHNSVREDPVITEFDPMKRFEYALENKLPFLQATTFWGIVNRESWYNDDYYKKYGELVYPANESLREAILLCANECSVGRVLEDWEVEAILSYLWSLELRVEDLNLSEEELGLLNKALRNGDSKKETVEMLKSKYALKSPATFVDPLKDLKKGLGYEGDPERGRQLFILSCLQCHKQNGVTQLKLDLSKYTRKFFNKKLYKGNNNYSLYHIIRKGTYSSLGKKAYMPHYTAERMSDQQIEDIVAYIKSK